MSGNSKPTQNDALSFELTDWLDKTQRLDSEATPGPWTASHRNPDDPLDATIIDSEACNGMWIASSDDDERERENAEWIAHARTALPAAVAALRAVAGLHQPRSRVTRSASGHLVDTPGPCTACDWDWPCPTVQAIQQHLT